MDKLALFLIGVSNLLLWISFMVYAAGTNKRLKDLENPVGFPPNKYESQIEVVESETAFQRYLRGKN